jgi:hypothetical protein
MNVMKGSLLICLATLLLTIPESASAKRKSQDKSDFKWQETTPADWAIGQDTSWPGAHAIMIFEKISVDERELLGDEVSISLYRRIRILDETGRSQADVMAPMDFGDQKVTEVLARSVQPGG